MRLLFGFALVIVGITFAQGQLVIPQIDNIDAVLSLLPQLQPFLAQLNSYLRPFIVNRPQAQIQALKEKIIQVVLSQAGGTFDFDTLKELLRPIIEQFLGSKPQARIDIDALLQQIAGASASSLPSVILGLLGKREATDSRAGINDILELADKLQLNTVLPQIELLLGPDKLQQLQNQFFATVVTGLGNNWNIATLSQALQQLVTQSVPQAAQMRIDWDAVGQAALSGVATALPSILIGAISLFGKRDLNLNYQQLLAQLSPDKLAQIVAVVTSADKTMVFAKLRKLLQSLFPAPQVRINFDDLAANLINHLNNLLPTLSQSIFATFLG